MDKQFDEGAFIKQVTNKLCILSLFNYLYFNEFVIYIIINVKL